MAAISTFVSCDKAGAKVQYEDYLKTNPNDHDARFNLAYCNQVIGQPAEAVKQYDEIARRSQSQCIVDVRDVALALKMFAEASVKGRSEDMLRSMDALEAAAGKYPDSYQVWHNLGEMRRTFGDNAG